MTTGAHIFLAHAREDKPQVRKLYAGLKARGLDPWLDEVDLVPGQIWKEEIPKAIRQAGVFLACLSSRSVGKVGYVQNEFRLALSAFAERPPGSIYFIPVRLDDCSVPDLQIPDRGLSLQDIHWVDLWQEGGFDRLVTAIERSVQASRERAAGHPAMLTVSEPQSPAAAVTVLASQFQPDPTQQSPNDRRAALEDTKPWWTLTATQAWVMTRDPSLVAKLCSRLSGVDTGATLLECASRGKGVRESREELVRALAAGEVTAHGDSRDGRGLGPIPAVEWSRLKFGYETGPDRAGPHGEIVLHRTEVVQHWPPKARDVLLAPGTVFRDLDATWCPQMLVIPAGSFVMGSPNEEEERDSAEGPQHRVTFASAFALGRFPVTFEEYEHFRIRAKQELPDEGWGRGQRPAINVSWEDARAYCAWLSEQAAQPYRLPSEAEWEYACRAETTTPFWTGATIGTDQANYDGKYTYGSGRRGEYRRQTTPVDTFEENPWGLHDMHGNVWEWCEDCWSGNYHGAPQDGSASLQGNCSLRVLRGGSWLRRSEDSALRQSQQTRPRRPELYSWLSGLQDAYPLNLHFFTIGVWCGALGGRCGEWWRFASSATCRSSD